MRNRRRRETTAAMGGTLAGHAPASQQAPASPEPTAQLLVQQALALHQRGKLAEAERLYDRALGSDPRHFDALHLVGVLRHQQGRSVEALRFVAAALDAQPGSADALTNYGVILDALKRHQEALAAFETVL